jgi:hypothetical protein
LAPLPTGVLPIDGGHFGANLAAYILDPYHHAQVTEPLRLEQLHEYGLAISAGQLHGILPEDKDGFRPETAEGLATGFAESSSVGTDDTSARHQGQHGYGTAVGNDLFAVFESRASKSRLNFLQVLQGPTRDCAIHETTRASWDRQQLPQAVRGLRTQGPQTFVGEQTWAARLAALAIGDERHVRLATEGAFRGGLLARDVSPELVVLRDGAPPFVVLVHAACWSHAERPLAKLVPPNEEPRAAITQLRSQIWELYQDRKAYREHPRAGQRSLLESRFDTRVGQRTGSPSIDGVLRDAFAESRRAASAFAAGGAVAQQRDGVGHSRVREASQDPWRDAERRWPALPGHVCEFEEDVPQAGGAVRGLPSGSGAWPGPGAAAGRPDPAGCAGGDCHKGGGRARLTEQRRARGPSDDPSTPLRFMLRRSCSRPRGFEKLL